MSTDLASKTQDLIDRHDRSMAINVGRYPIVLSRGQGSTLWDVEGKEYLDLFAGFGASVLGHCHPDLITAVTKQANKLWHAGNLFHTEPQVRMAEAIARLGFGGRSFFCHSGADANEAALKLSRLFGHAHPGAQGPRYKIISTLNSFHGRTFGTMKATGQKKVYDGFDPLPNAYVHVPYGDLAAIEAAIDPLTVAVMLEPIQGEGGVNVPAPDFLPQLRALCDQRQLLLICDEVWTGGGRTGRYFAHQHWDIRPDVMTLAKGVGGGLPVGVCCIAEEHAELFDWRKQGRVVHATTLGGNALSMAVGATIFEVLERDNLVQRAEVLGNRAMTRLRALAQASGLIRDVRGRGLFIGVELNLEAPGVWFKSATDVVNRCLERGLMIGSAQNDVLRIAPAVTIEDEQITRGLDVLAETLTGA